MHSSPIPHKYVSDCVCDRPNRNDNNSSLQAYGYKNDNKE